MKLNIFTLLYTSLTLIITVVTAFEGGRPPLTRSPPIGARKDSGDGNIAASGEAENPTIKKPPSKRIVSDNGGGGTGMNTMAVIGSIAGENIFETNIPKPPKPPDPKSTESTKKGEGDDASNPYSNTKAVGEGNPTGDGRENDITKNEKPGKNNENGEGGTITDSSSKGKGDGTAEDGEGGGNNKALPEANSDTDGIGSGTTKTTTESQAFGSGQDKDGPAKISGDMKAGDTSTDQSRESSEPVNDNEKGIVKTVSAAKSGVSSTDTKNVSPTNGLDDAQVNVAPETSSVDSSNRAKQTSSNMEGSEQTLTAGIDKSSSVGQTKGGSVKGNGLNSYNDDEPGLTVDDSKRVDQTSERTRTPNKAEPTINDQNNGAPVEGLSGSQSQDTLNTDEDNGSNEDTGIGGKYDGSTVPKADAKTLGGDLVNGKLKNQFDLWAKTRKVSPTQTGYESNPEKGNSLNGQGFKPKAGAHNTGLNNGRPTSGLDKWWTINKGNGGSETLTTDHSKPVEKSTGTTEGTESGTTDKSESRRSGKKNEELAEGRKSDFFGLLKRIIDFIKCW